MQRSKLVDISLTSFLAPILILLALIAGAISLWMTAKEEDPQIVVPMADVLVTAPGLSAKQVERQVTQPLENLLYQIQGVEYVYSTSMTGQAQVIVRYKVGQEREDALIRLYNKLDSNIDIIPASVTSWVVKPVEIDDVPILVAAISSRDPQQLSQNELRRLAEEAAFQLQALDNANKVSVTGGNPREIIIDLDAIKMTSHSTTLDDIQRALSVSNVKQEIGNTHQHSSVIKLQSGAFLQSISDVKNLVVNIINGVPVYMRDIAQIKDGNDLPNSYTWYQTPQDKTPNPAVFLSVAKKQGSNAVSVAQDALHTLNHIAKTQWPSNVQVDVIRNYGKTASDKVNNLVSSLGIAILTVVVFVGFFLNWRSALVVGIAIPISYGFALAMDLAFGYTINRVTLFALILALGLIVDDPIASIDNIERYLAKRGLKKSKAISLAMAEIRIALIMSTIAIVIVFMPMFFITGMMGPYMAPLAFNVPISVIFSTLVAFAVTPWLAKKILRQHPEKEVLPIQETSLYKGYSKVLRPLLTDKRKSKIFLLFVALLFVIAATLPVFRAVPLKLLPYDNKNEFQLILDMPETTSLEQTNNALQVYAQQLNQYPEVTSVSSFTGTASPMDFNGMVRHYFMRAQSYQGELRVTLVDKLNRSDPSHEFVTRIRPQMEKIAREYNAKVKLVEMPPGPPVISTIVAEIYANSQTPYSTLEKNARMLVERLQREPFVSEIDTSIDETPQRMRFIVDQEKAALSGISVQSINQLLATANQGATLSYLHDANEVNPTPIKARLPADKRDNLQALTNLYVRGQAGVVKNISKGQIQDAPQPMVQLRELGTFISEENESPIYHKNLKPVVYVYAESIGRVPAEIIADMIGDHNKKPRTDSNTINPIDSRNYLNNGGGDGWKLDDEISLVWNGEGEWKITLDVFRDLGIAYGVALLGVFIIMLIQTGLPAVSGIIMLAIPLTIIGIMPGFWLLNHLGQTSISGYPNPSLFTATAMIGMIALAGIVVRNSLVLIEFIHQALSQGKSLVDALLEAGAVRMRPIILTAGTTLLGNIVITLDPIFNGLAWAIIFGITASTLFTLLVVPIVYNLAYSNTPNHGLPQKEIL